MAEAEQRFWAMGTIAHVVIEADDTVPDDDGTLLDDDGDRERLFDQARTLLEDLEARWSRFRADSELCAINDRDASTVGVSADTLELVGRAIDAWWSTDGRFDPTVLPALTALGYDRSFEVLGSPPASRRAVRPTVTSPSPTATAPSSAPGCSDITVRSTDGTITLPPGVRLDLGGIGKGAAADRVATMLDREVAGGVLVNLGGDLRVTSRRGCDAAWTVALSDPRDRKCDLAWVRLAEGGLATSSVADRRWDGPDGPTHHLIDPTTGRSADRGVQQVSVFAAETWWAEVLAKAALIAGVADGVALVERHRAAALIVTDDGDLVGAGNVEDFLT